jgi:hypothetical protein
MEILFVVRARPGYRLHKCHHCGVTVEMPIIGQHAAVVVEEVSSASA